MTALLSEGVQCQDRVIRLLEEKVDRLQQEAIEGGRAKMTEAVESILSENEVVIQKTTHGIDAIRASAAELARGHLRLKLRVCGCRRDLAWSIPTRYQVLGKFLR